MSRMVALFAAFLFSAAPLFAQGNPYPKLPTGGEGAATIQGQVSLPGGKPAKNVYLRLEAQGRGGLIQSASTDSSGSFSFGNVALGANYRITGTLQGYRPIDQLVMVTSQMSYVSITLTAAPGKAPPAGGTVSAENVNVPPKALEEFNRGVLAADNGKKKDAEDAFRKAVQIYPKYAASYMRLSSIYADEGRFPDAHKAIGKALELQKDTSTGYAYLGYVYLREKQADKAEQAFQKSLAISKDDWFAHLELGRLRYDQGRYADAYPHLERAHQLHPQLRSVHLLLYDDLIRLQKNKEALAELDDIVRLFPGSPETAKMKKVRPALAAAVAKQQH
jgi:tetratricopeptide (TPR) repeat protein